MKASPRNRSTLVIGLAAVAIASSCGGPRTADPSPTPGPDPTPEPADPVAISGPAVTAPHPACLADAPPAPAIDDRSDDFSGKGSYPGYDGDGGRIDSSDDMCVVADNNIEDAIVEILATDVPDPIAAGKPWNKRTNPAHFDHVAQRLALSNKERALLKKNGFVVSSFDEYPSYAYAYHEVYQSQLPIYITVDSIFNAIYAGHDALVTSVEQTSIAPATRAAVHAMHCELSIRAAAYPADLAHDLDLYFTVALSLLDGQMVASKLGDSSVDDEAAVLVGKATNADELTRMELFGRTRMIDFTQYQPRGHYAENGLKDYFRGAMWLSRLELNLVSRSSQSSAPEIERTETPREVRIALALAELADGAGVMDDIAGLDRAWTLFAGTREDITLHQIAALAKGANIESAASDGAAKALITAIGDDFQRTQRLHFTPDGVAVLPAIATLLGPRTVTDTRALLRLVNGEVPSRFELSATDIAYTLGHDRAKTYLTDDLSLHPNLATQLDIARADIAAVDAKSGDLYSAWLTAIREVATEPSGVMPSFMETTAYEDLQMNTAITGYGQLRHNHVLLAGQGYDAYGCEIPSGYVEPKPAVYAALADYTALGQAAMAEIGDDAAVAYFARVGRIMRVLERIAEHQLAGVPLTKAQQRFLSMVAEMREGSSGGPPAFTGWYFDLFEARSDDGTKQADFIADYYTSTTASSIAYIGAGAPHLGAFVVDVGGKPRLVVGPVARGYEYTGSLSTRLDDDASMKLSDRDRVDPWADSYMVANGAEPNMSIQFQWNERYDANDEHISTKLTAKVTAPKKVGKVTIELLDHHREVERSAARYVGAGVTTFRFPEPKAKESKGSKGKSKTKQKPATMVDEDDFDELDDDYEEDYGGWSMQTLVVVRAGDYVGIHEVSFEIGPEEMGIFLGSVKRPDYDDYYE
jgi:hypothetical protein